MYVRIRPWFEYRIICSPLNKIYFDYMFYSLKPDAGVKLFLKGLQSTSHIRLMTQIQIWGEFKTGGKKNSIKWTVQNLYFSFLLFVKFCCIIFIWNYHMHSMSYSKRIFLLKREFLSFEIVKIISAKKIMMWMKQNLLLDSVEGPTVVFTDNGIFW